MFSFKQKINILSLVVSGIMLLFFLSFFFPLEGTMIGDARDNIANVTGVSASIEPNRYNTLAQQFEEKSLELKEKEQGLVERENALLGVSDDGGVITQNDVVTYGTIISSGLFLLVSANFYFDWRRSRRMKFTQV